MTTYSIITSTVIVIFIICHIHKYKNIKKSEKIESLFYEDFYNLLPKHKNKDFKKFIKENTFVISAQNNRFDDRFNTIPKEKKFIKIFKKAFPKKVNIHYTFNNQKISFIISFDCHESLICDALEKITDMYPTIFFGISQILPKEKIYLAIDNNLKNGSIKILSPKYLSNAKKASDMGVFNKKNVYRFDVSENKILPKSSLETETKIITAFKFKKIEEVNELILNAFETADNYSQCMYVANNLLFILYNILQKNNITIEEIYGDNVNLYRWASGSLRKESMTNFMQSWYKKAILYTEEHCNKINDIEQKIKKYIEDNYNNDISIATMSEYFGVSNQYFSRFFKSQTGNTFLDTLNKYRIKKALELIGNSNLTMIEIGTMVGFNNYKSFARNFKKYTGKIPSEYTKK